jgi:hypothetical protein
MAHAFKKIVAAIIPVFIMVALIGIIEDDVVLSLVFIAIIGIALYLKYERHDLLFLLAGGILFPVAEYLFVSTGVEVFRRASLFGVMPLWIPFLWAYGFVAVKRIVVVLNEKVFRNLPI